MLAQIAEFLVGEVASSIMGALQRLGHRRRSSRLGEGALIVRCYLRGSVDPYPRALYPGRLEVSVIGPTSFIADGGTVRELQLPAHGLTIDGTRATTPADKFVTLSRRNFVDATIFDTHDQLGNAVQVVALPGLREKVEQAIGQTRYAISQPAPQLVRSVSRLRSLIPVRGLFGCALLALLLGGIIVLGKPWNPADLLAVSALIYAVLLPFAPLPRLVMWARERRPSAVTPALDRRAL